MVQTGMNNAALAAKTDLTPTAFSQIVTGHREPRLRTALKIARELQTTVEELFAESK